MPDPIKWRNHLLAFFLFVILTLIMTWPVVARLTTHLAGGRDDLWVHQWTFWWIREALREGLNPFFTPYLYAPVGTSLTSHNIAWFNIALWLPLQAIFGHTAAYNLVFLTVIILNGFCMYLFAWESMRSYGAALLAGIIFGFWPYTLSHYDHANMMVVFWVPLTLLLLQRLLLGTAEEGSESTRFRWLLIAGTTFSLAMIGITRWQLLIMSSPILIGYTLYLFWENPKTRTRRAILEITFVVGLAVLLMAPLAAPLLIDQFTREFPEDVFLDEAVWGRTDLLAYIIPSINNGIWHDWVARFYENFVVNKYYTPFLGFMTLLLAITGIIRRWRRCWMWLLLAILYFVLALGPELAINGRAYPAISMPYRLVEDLFLMRLIRRPDRLNLFLGLPLAMLAGWGMQSTLLNIASVQRRRFVVAVTMGLVILAYWPVPFSTAQARTPAWLTQQAVGEIDYAILNLPINDRSYDKWYMQYQIDHRIPIATGHVSRLPRESTAFINSVPFLADLRERDQVPDPEILDVGHQLQLLSDAGVKFLIVDKAFANEGLQNVWREWLVVDPIHDDDELLVYDTAIEAKRSFDFEYDLGHDIGLIRAVYGPAEGVPGGLIKVNTAWGTTAVPSEDLDICLLLVNEESIVVSEICQQPDDLAKTSDWPANDVRRASYVLPLDRDVSPGDYKVLLTLSEPDTMKPVGNSAELGKVRIAPFEPDTVTNAIWQDGPSLLGAKISEENNQLEVTLYWQAEQPMEISYKVFLHLQDNSTGEIIAQSDTIPRNWTYPTTAWEPDEIVRDVVSLSLENIPEGSYNLLVGLYNELTGERLILLSPDADALQDAIILTTMER